MRALLRSSLAAAAFVVSLMIAPAALACRCMEYQTPNCAEYWRAKFVFVAKVKSVRRESIRIDILPPGAAVNTMSENNPSALLQIQEVLRGDIAGEVLDSVGDGVNCLVEYKKGKRYLIFANYYDPAAKMITTSRCAGTTRLERDDEDYLAQFRELGRRKAETSVMGQVSEYWTEEPLTGIEVRLEADGRSETVMTDGAGRYSFALKQGGPFKVSLIFPFRALEGDHAEVDYLSEEPARTVLGYEKTLPAGQCHYTELHVAKVPE